MVTLKDIAQECGVAVSTVSTALNYPRKISKDLRDRIFVVAREKGYLSNNNKLSQVLLVVDNYKDYFYGEYYRNVIFGIQDELQKNRVKFSIAESANIESSGVYDYDGIIFIGRTTQKEIDVAQKYKVPFVLAGHPFYQNKYPCVYQNAEEGVKFLLEYAISLGHKEIALVSGENDANDYAWGKFCQSFFDVKKRHGLECDYEDLFYASYHKVEMVEIAVSRILSSEKEYSLIFCSSDLIAYYAYSFLQKHGKSVPGDISLMGFDGNIISRELVSFCPKITTVYCDRELIGGMAVEALMKLVFNDAFDGQVVDMVPQIQETVKKIN